MRVLLIEDDRSIAQSIELMLKAENLNVYTTDLGEEGIDLGKSFAHPPASGPQSATETPLRIPFGNKTIALDLGARYRSGRWYAPPGVNLAAFCERGWL